MITSTNLTFFLFEATSISASTIKDEYKQSAKHWFNLWWNQGIKLWKELKIAIKNEQFANEAEDVYDDNAAFIYELARIAVDIDISKREEIIKYLRDANNNATNLTINN